MNTATLTVVDARQLNAQLASRERFELRNVLTDDYFSGRMIPGSKRVPLDRIGRHVADAGLDRDTEIVVYCTGPGCPQSRLAAEKLSRLGFVECVLGIGGHHATANHDG